VQHGAQVRGEEQVGQPGVSVWLLREQQQAEVHHLVVKTILPDAAPLSTLASTALHDLANANHVRMVQPHYLLESDGIQRHTYNCFQRSGRVGGAVREGVALLVEDQDGGVDSRRQRGCMVGGIVGDEGTMSIVG